MKALTGDYWSYDDLVESMEFDEVLVEKHDDNYQGDSYYLVRHGQGYGYLTFGWGSCSGCDALQDCNSLQEVTELRDELHDQVRWFLGVGQALAFFRDEEFLKTQWYGHDSAFVKFRDEVVVKLENLRPSLHDVQAAIDSIRSV